MKDVLAVLFTMLLAVTLVACDSNDDDGGDDAATAQVRFVHSAPDAGPVDVFLGDQEVEGNFAYKAPTPSDPTPAASDYLDVPVETEDDLTVRDQEGNTVLSVDVGAANLSEDAFYTVIVAGAAAATTEAPEIILLRDQFINLDEGQIALRLVHGSALAEDAFADGVDIYIADAGQQSLDGETPLLTGFNFTQDSGSVGANTPGLFTPRALSTGTQQAVYVTANGSTQPQLQVPIGGDGGLPISSGQFVTGIAADVPDGEGSLTVGAQAIIQDDPSAQ